MRFVAFQYITVLVHGLQKSYVQVQNRDCNPGPVFSIPGFGIEKFLIPGSRDPGGITKLVVILANSTKLSETRT